MTLVASKPAAESGLEKNDIRRFPGKRQVGGGRGDLEEG